MLFRSTSTIVKEIDTLPAPNGPKIAVAVYGFKDLTGQRKNSQTLSLFSTAVTQGAESYRLLRNPGNFRAGVAQDIRRRPPPRCRREYRLSSRDQDQHATRRNQDRLAATLACRYIGSDGVPARPADCATLRDTRHPQELPSNLSQLILKLLTVCVARRHGRLSRDR